MAARQSLNAPILGGDRSGRTGREPALSVERVLGLALSILRDDELPADQRRAAADALVRLGKGVVPLLLDLMHDPNPAVRHASSRALGLILDKRFTGKLVRSAAWTFAALQEAETDQRAADRLLEALQIGSRPTLVATAVALGRLGDLRALAELAELIGGEELLPRLAAIYALGRLGHPAGVPYLTDALDDPDELVRSAARDALLRMDAPGAAAAPDGGLEEDER